MRTNKIIGELEAEMMQRELPDVTPGDTVSVQIRVKEGCLLYTSPSPRDRQKSRMPSSA